MTVKELLDHLAQLPPDLEVLVASDAEGNRFHPLDSRSMETFLGCPGRGSTYDITTEEDWYYDGHDEPYPGDNCVVLWP